MTDLGDLQLPSGRLQFPAFLPDATQGVVRAVDSADLIQCGVQALVMNTFHLMLHPGSSTVSALGGLHAMSGWPRPIVTDSGGFQAYSLIRQNAKYGTLSDSGILFRPEGSKRKMQLTPEKCVRLQMSYGSDVIMCLDDCTHVDDSELEQRRSVQRTIAWAERCRQEFDRLLDAKCFAPGEQPRLFAVIQGGGSQDLRRCCAEELLAIGFDGYGYGGWPLDSQGDLLVDMLAYSRELVPDRLPMHALGVGHPESIAVCTKLGYGMFDSAVPTRDARHGRLYTFVSGEKPSVHRRGWFQFLYIQDEKYRKDNRPLSNACTCLTCRHYTRGYLHHLSKSNVASYQRLATIHNLQFMVHLTDQLRCSDLSK
jgi:queuine tRNA-ribosyltransferase